ncbi:MAG: glycosyltransferase [Clostridia bacterium]|nr:glycosyltransferase [Clostridia bacterium]
MISVALAAYKGEKYIAEQINSILIQLGAEDEIVVSDDAPGGETEKTVKELCRSDPRVRYIAGKGEGLIRNFQNALEHCNGDIIFLSDQDDMWLPGKVKKVCEKINGGAMLVLHDCAETDALLNVINPSYFALRGSSGGFWGNIIKNSYMGCCMAFKKELLSFALPFPEKIPMHDQWLGLIAERTGKTQLIYEPLIYHRVHGNNMTGGKTSAADKLLWRIRLIICLIKKGV